MAATTNQQQSQPPTHAELMDHLELAWGVIANAGGWVHGGRVESSSPGWLEAAQRWRDRWHEILSADIAARQARGEVV